ncbi:MAG: DUF4384 domain-containing protein [Alphaproteobacteria bacterium]
MVRRRALAAAAAAAATVAFLAVGTAWAEWLPGRGEQVFGPEVPEAEACRAAEGRALETLLREAGGERVGAEQMMLCQGDDGDCAIDRHVWSTVDGEIAGVRDRRAATAPAAEGLRRCTVSLEADVVVAGPRDPAFDVGVDVNRTIFRDGESLTLRLSPSQPLYVAVFQWRGEEVVRLFPNAFDRDPRFETQGILPRSQAYDFAVVFPDGQPAGRRMVEEFLLVVATAEPVSFRETYAIDEFRARLLELPRQRSRTVKRVYGVVRR